MENNYNVVWNIPNNKIFESVQDVIKHLRDYSIDAKEIESEMKNHTAIAVPNHLVQRAVNAIVYKFGRNYD